MEGERILRALSRIEAAAARIERATHERPSQSDPRSDPELERRYDTLRHETGTALAELDRLIGALEP